MRCWPELVANKPTTAAMEIAPRPGDISGVRGTDAVGGGDVLTGADTQNTDTRQFVAIGRGESCHRLSTRARMAALTSTGSDPDPRNGSCERWHNRPPIVDRRSLHRRLDLAESVLENPVPTSNSPRTPGASSENGPDAGRRNGNPVSAVTASNSRPNHGLRSEVPRPRRQRGRPAAEPGGIRARQWRDPALA